jgi:hypothetical protein
MSWKNLHHFSSICCGSNGGWKGNSLYSCSDRRHARRFQSTESLRLRLRSGNNLHIIAKLYTALNTTGKKSHITRPKPPAFGSNPELDAVLKQAHFPAIPSVC